MDLAWSATDSAFRDELRAFLQEKLTPELRQAGRLMTSVYADHEASMEWQRILHERGWAAPAWPVEYGGCDWSLTQHYIFSRESQLSGAPSLSPMGIRMVAHAIIKYGTDAQKEYFLPRILTTIRRSRASSPMPGSAPRCRDPRVPGAGRVNHATWPGGPVSDFEPPSDGYVSGDAWQAVAPLRYFNDRAGSIYAGSNEIQRNILAKAALGL